MSEINFEVAYSIFEVFLMLAVCFALFYGGVVYGRLQKIEEYKKLKEYARLLHQIGHDNYAEDDKSDDADDSQH